MLSLFYRVAYATRKCESTSTRVPAVASRRVAHRSSRRRERPVGAHACMSTLRVHPVRVACKVEIRRTTPYYVVLAKQAGTDVSAASVRDWPLTSRNPVNLPKLNYLVFNVAITAITQ